MSVLAEARTGGVINMRLLTLLQLIFWAVVIQRSCHGSEFR
jgi:hypothetical protein